MSIQSVADDRDVKIIGADKDWLLRNPGNLDKQFWWVGSYAKWQIWVDVVHYSE